jgi:shikimate kinase
MAPSMMPSVGLLERIWQVLDPRLKGALMAEFEAVRVPRLELQPAQRVVLVGHRAAGKSSLLPLVAEWTGLLGIDLDVEIAARSCRDLRGWVSQDEAGFRTAERETFDELPGGVIVAAGGGFLSVHAEALAGQVPVLVPITSETYRERLLADTTRPRLRPELSLVDEIDRVYTDRERLHARVVTVPLARFLRATARVH